MKIIIHDIAEKKTGEGWSQDLPDGFTLGELFDRDDQLRQFAKTIMQVTINGRAIANWRDVTPDRDSVVKIDVRPGQFAWTIIYIIILIISIVTTVLSIVLKPSGPKHDRGDNSPTYTFEGIQDTFAPGEVIPVTYGKQRKGGQVLMYYLTMLPDKSGLAMSMMLSMGEGPVDSIDDIELNDLSVSVLSSVTIQTALGVASQDVMEGFEEIKNTFHDGREITDAILNGPDGKHTDSFGAINGQQTFVVYRTVGNDVNRIEAFIGALNGMVCKGLKGSYYDQWSKYLVEYRDSGQGANECDQIEWSVFGYYQVNGKYERPYWDSVVVPFPYPSRWDIKFTWTDAKCNPVGAHPGTVSWELWLQEVTEFRGEAPAVRNEALMTVRATPTRDLQGGRPKVTALVRGLKPDVYTTVNSYVNRWSQNPAWCVADYMTNSRYGMGAYISKSELDLQSFIDFATLCDSLVSTCGGTAANTFTPEGDCVGTPDFHSGDPPMGDGGFLTGIVPDPPECIGLRSKYDGATQYGMCIDRICCPPYDNCYGVFSGEALCEDAYRWLTVTRIDTGYPVFGLISWVQSGSTVDTFTGYGMIVHHGSHTVSLVRWKNQACNTYGTILVTKTACLEVGDYMYLAVEAPYTAFVTPINPGSYDWYNHDDTSVRIFFQSSNGTVKVDTTYLDTWPNNITKGGCGGIAEQGLGGVIALPNDMAGDYHMVHLEEYSHLCGLCQQPCDPGAGGCLCDTYSSSALNGTTSSGKVLRHWDDSCQRTQTRFNESDKWHIIGAGMDFSLPNAPF